MLSSPPKGANRGQHVNVNKCAVVEGRVVWIVDSIERDVALGWPEISVEIVLFPTPYLRLASLVATVWLPIFRAKTFSDLISPEYRSACGELSVNFAFNIRTNVEDGEEQLEGMLPQQFAPPETFPWLFFEALARSEDTRWRRSMLKAVFATTKFRAVAWFLSELL